MTKSGHLDSKINLDQILVIIPVLNEEVALGDVLRSLQDQGLKQIRVIDNGSTDQSAAIAQSYNVEVIREPQRGYGQACWRGLQTMSPDIRWILFCDGDGSDDLTQLPQFFAAAETADFILANRRYTAQSRRRLTPPQNFGNGLAVQLMRWGWGHQYHDLGPLRLIRRSALNLINMQDRAFGWTVEMQVRAIECGLSIQEIPVLYCDRQGGESKISGTVQGVFKAGVGILSTLGQLYWRRSQKMDEKPLVITLIAAILLVLGAVLVQPHGNFDSTASFSLFGIGIGIMLLGFVLSWLLPHISALWFWSVALLTRIILLPMASGDDVWRYLWEGYVPSKGFSPYALPPNAEALAPFRTEWWELMNHHDTSAIYPPVAQMGFQLLAHVSLTVVAFKIGFVLADLATCWVLSRRFGYQSTLIYAWNPLVIYAFAGGAHYDSWFIFPLVMAWLLAEKHQWLKSAFWIGLSIGVKWMSLPLLGFVVWKNRWNKTLIILAVAAIPLLVTLPRFCLLGSCTLIPVQSSFVVRARSAELLPYVVEYLWPASRELNWIFAIPLGLILLVLLKTRKTFGSYAESYFLALLVLAPVVHAWYFTWLIPFGVASRNLGTKFLSISGFVYFLLPYRQFAGIEGERWFLTISERALLWLPFLLGYAISLLWAAKSRPSSPTPFPQADL
jgi:hypothetical protein